MEINFEIANKVINNGPFLRNYGAFKMTGYVSAGV
jgi:hypothetical protein